MSIKHLKLKIKLLELKLKTCSSVKDREKFLNETNEGAKPLKEDR